MESSRDIQYLSSDSDLATYSECAALIVYVTSKITAHNRLVKIHLPCPDFYARPGVSTLDAPFSAVGRLEPLWQELLDEIFSYKDHDLNHIRAYFTISTPPARVVSSSNVSAQKRTGRLRKTSSCNIAHQKLPERSQPSE